MICLDRFDKLKEIQLKLMAIEMIKSLKEHFTYEELSKILNINESILCRYVRGDILPSLSQSQYIANSLRNSKFIRDFIFKKVKVYEDGFVDLSEIYEDPSILKVTVYLLFSIIPQEFNKILTPSVNGLPFAILFSQITRSKIIISKKYMDSRYIQYTDEIIEERNALITKMYIRKDSIRKGDKILIIDDVMRTGKTLSTLVSLVNKQKGIVVGAGLIVCLGNEWKRVLPDNFKVFTLIKM